MSCRIETTGRGPEWDVRLYSRGPLKIRLEGAVPAGVAEFLRTAAHRSAYLRKGTVP